MHGLQRSLALTVVSLAVVAPGCQVDEREEKEFDWAGETGAFDGGETSEGGDDAETTEGAGEGATSTGFQAGNDDGPDVCADLEANVEAIPPTVILLIDQSGSMDDDFGGMMRWDAVYDTLQDPTNGIVRTFEDRVRFGLALYTSFDGFEGGACPVLHNVEPSLHNFDAIDATFAPQGPEADTPTGEAIEAIANQLAADDTPGKKIIVLATDGEPDTCDQPDPQEGQDVAVAAAQEAFALGIDVRVISVGDEVGESHLQDMANAGLGLPLGGSENATYFQALESQGLVDAFSEITGDAVSCTFAVDGKVDLDNACEGTVTLDGAELDCGTQWEMLDASTLELTGDACDTLKDGDNHEVDASFPCEFYVP